MTCDLVKTRRRSERLTGPSCIAASTRNGKLIMRRLSTACPGCSNFLAGVSSARRVIAVGDAIYLARSAAFAAQLPEMLEVFIGNVLVGRNDTGSPPRRQPRHPRGDGSRKQA